MKTRDVVKQSYLNFWHYRKDYIKANILFQLMRVAIITPLTLFFIQQILRFNGLNGMTQSDIFGLFKHPISLILIVIMLIIYLFFIFFEFGLYFIYSDKHGSEQLGFRSTILQLVHKMKYFVSFQLILFLIYFIVILPIASIGLEGSFTSQIYIPHFITDELVKSSLGKISYFLILAVLFYISLRLVYTIPFFIFNKKATIIKSIKQSFAFSKGKSWQTLKNLGGVLATHSLISAAFVGICFLLVICLEKFTPSAAPYFSSIILSIIEVFSFVAFGALQALFAESLVLLIKQHQPIHKTKLGLTHYPLKHKAWVYPLLVTGFIGMCLFNYSYLNKTVYQPQTLIISHRGDTKKAIENTLPAIQNAKNNDAEMVEIDIQQTKDGSFVLYHDETLKRLGNSNKKIANLTLKELEGITLRQGSLNSKIPTLQEAIDLAKKIDIRLLIEIKFPYTNKAISEKAFIDLLQKNNVEQFYYVQGLNATQMNTVETLSPIIKTGKIIAFNFGKLPKTSTDFLVLEEFSYSEKALQEAHSNKKELFVWTINKESLMRKYINMGADGVITDSTKEANSIKESVADGMSFTEKIRKAIE